MNRRPCIIVCATNMKISAYTVKPGTIIKKVNKKFKNDYLLVTAVTKGNIVEITGFPYQDSYYGRIVQTFKMSEKVKVIQNKNKRSKIFKSIIQDAFKQLHDAKDNIDLLKLIQESFKLCK